LNRVLRCYCGDDCPPDSQNSTCTIFGEGQCYSTVKILDEIDPETNTNILEYEFGCLSSGLFQVRKRYDNFKVLDNNYNELFYCSAMEPKQHIFIKRIFHVVEIEMNVIKISIQN
jgi:hypothetical protein